MARERRCASIVSVGPELVLAAFVDDVGATDQQVIDFADTGHVLVLLGQRVEHIAHGI